MGSRGIAWLSDLFQVFFVDRFNARSRPYSLRASTAARSCHFHAHAPIPEQPLNQILHNLAGHPVLDVTLPGPQTELGDVGSHTFYYTLGSLVRALQPKIILEFGTYLGVSAYTMALNAPQSCRLYTVDLPDAAQAGPSHALNRIDQGHIHTSRGRVGQAFLGTPQETLITQIRADSLSLQIKDHLAQADLILVDGGHSTPIVTRDTENAFSVLASKGVIVWDDYFHLYPDVVNYLNQLSQRHSLRRISGTNFVVHQRST